MKPFTFPRASLALAVLAIQTKAQNVSSHPGPPFKFRLDDSPAAEACILQAIQNNCGGINGSTNWVYTSYFHVEDSILLCQKAENLCPILLHTTDAGVVPGWPLALVDLLTHIWTVRRVDVPLVSYTDYAVSATITVVTTCWWWAVFNVWKRDHLNESPIVDTTGWVVSLVASIRVRAALHDNGFKIFPQNANEIEHNGAKWITMSALTIITIVVAVTQGITSLAVAFIQLAPYVGRRAFIPTATSPFDLTTFDNVFLSGPRYKLVARVRLMEILFIIPALGLSSAKFIWGHRSINHRSNLYEEGMYVITKPIVIATIAVSVIARICEMGIGLGPKSLNGHYGGEGEGWIVIAPSDRFGGYDGLVGRNWLAIRSMFNAG